MEILLDEGRQYTLSAERTITFADGLAIAVVDDAVQDVFKLPTGARIVGGEVVVETAWNMGTTGVIDVGDVTDPNRYSSTAVNLQATGRTALTLDGFKTTETEKKVNVTPALVGTTATQGQAYIRIEYVIEDRAHEVQPLDVADYGSKNAP